MNTSLILRRVVLSLASAFLVPVVFAENPSPATPPARSSTPSIAPVAAHDWLYRDVYASDGRKVGDVVDYVLQFTKLPQLRYVIIQSGGFVGLGGEQRAIPADAFTLTNDRFHVNLTHSEFEQLPVLPERPRHFFNNATNLSNLARQCGTPEARAALTGDYVFFSSLNDDDMIIGAGNEELGRFSDLWIDFNVNEAPYIEMTPVHEELSAFGAVRYEIPTTTFARERSDEIYVTLPVAALVHARVVEDVRDYVASAGEKLEILQLKTSK